MSSIRVVLLALAVTLGLTLYAAAQQPNRPARPGDERIPDKLTVGDAAPDFTLKVMDGKDEQTVTLSDFAGDRPVALIFGSYT